MSSLPRSVWKKSASRNLNRGRSSSKLKPRDCAIPIFTPPMEIGRSNPRFPSFLVMKAWGLLRAWEQGSRRSKKETGLPSPGWAMPVAPASTVYPAGRRSVSVDAIPAIFFPEPMPNMPPPSPTMSPKYRQR